jgi:hypothetical protein
MWLEIVIVTILLAVPDHHESDSRFTQDAEDAIDAEYL